MTSAPPSDSDSPSPPLTPLTPSPPSDSVSPPSPPSDTAALIRRLKWRSRRGTLELDLTLERFWRARENNLTPDELQALDEVLDGDDEEVARAFSPGGIFG